MFLFGIFIGVVLGIGVIALLSNSKFADLESTISFLKKENFKLKEEIINLNNQLSSLTNMLENTKNF